MNRIAIIIPTLNRHDFIHDIEVTSYRTFIFKQIIEIDLKRSFGMVIKK